MKTNSIILALLFAAGGSTAADLGSFPVYRELQPPAGGSGDVASVVLDHPIYAAAGGPRVDLRIIDQDNREIPFHVRIKAPAKSTFHESPFPAEVLSFRELPDNRVEIIARRDTTHAIPVALRIHTSKRNFEKQVTVSGSTDRERWTVLAEAIPVFDYSRFIDVRNDRINLEPRDFVLYKIEVSNITENKDSPLTEIIRKRSGGVETETTEINAFRKELFHMDRLEFIERKEIVQSGDIETREDAVHEWIAVPEAEQRQTVVTFNAVREPLTVLTLQTEESNFSRPVAVFAADGPKDTWTPIASGRISRIDAGKVHQQSLAIPLNGERRHQRYRIVIENQDNPPLMITGLRARANVYEALFFPKPDCSYRMYYGGSGVSAPSYDTETVLKSVLPGATTAWSLNAEQKNPGFKKPGAPSKFDSKTLLIVAVVIMVVVLAWAMVRVTRQVESAGKGGGTGPAPDA